MKPRPTHNKPFFTALPDRIKEILPRVDGSEISKSSHYVYCHVYGPESTYLPLEPAIHMYSYTSYIMVHGQNIAPDV